MFDDNMKNPHQITLIKEIFNSKVFLVCNISLQALILFLKINQYMWYEFEINKTVSFIV